MDYQEKFEFMKCCLKKWNYPDIHAMNDTEVPEVFSSTKRPFLVSWLLKRLYPELLANNKNYSGEESAKFMYDMGLCTKTQMNTIFSSKFDPDQMNLLYKVFSILDKIVSAPTIVAEYSKLTLKELDNYDNIDLNLFPCYGPTTILTREERQSLEEKLERELHSINRDDNVPDEPVLNATILKAYEEEASQILNNMRSLMPKFMSVSTDFCQQHASLQKEPVVIDHDKEDIIRRCATNMQKISQYFRYIRSLIAFVADGDKLVLPDVPGKAQEAFWILKKLLEQTREIVNPLTVLNREG